MMTHHDPFQLKIKPMNPLRSLLAASLVACICSTPAARALDLGDPAPELKINSWVKGDAVDLKAGKGKNIYVVEFWATWCPPCRASIPHLTELQKKFKDKHVTFIGITDEEAATVQPFVKRMGDKMEYVVAIDKERATMTAYMEPFQIGGIPHAFVVNQQGNLVWHGHPMAGLDKVVEQVVAGTFDAAAAKRAAGAPKLAQQYFGIVTEGKLTPEAKKIGRQILEDASDNPELLNDLAWAILVHPAVQDRDLDLAMSAAKKAYDGTDQKDASIADTYARALFDTGKVAEAVKIQKKALKDCDDDELRSGLEEALKRYEKALASEKK